MQIMTQMMSVMLDAVDSVDVSAIGENICGILSEISDLNSECQVILLTVYDPFEGVQGMEMMDVAAREKLGELNAEIFEEAKGHGVEVADVHSRFEGHGAGIHEHFLNGLHPEQGRFTALFIRCCPGLTAEQTSAPVTGAVTR